MNSFLADVIQGGVCLVTCPVLGKIVWINFWKCNVLIITYLTSKIVSDVVVQTSSVQWYWFLWQSNPHLRRGHWSGQCRLGLAQAFTSWCSNPITIGSFRIAHHNFISRPFFHPQPPSLPIWLPEPGSERKVLTKETWFPLLREWKSWKLQWEQFLPRQGSP